MLNTKKFKTASNNTHRWQAIQLLPVWLQILNIKCFESTCKKTHWWETIQLLKMQHKIHPFRRFEKPFKKESYFKNYKYVKLLLSSRNIDRTYLKSIIETKCCQIIVKNHWMRDQDFSIELNAHAYIYPKFSMRRSK